MLKLSNKLTIGAAIIVSCVFIYFYDADNNEFDEKLAKTPLAVTSKHTFNNPVPLNKQELFSKEANNVVLQSDQSIPVGNIGNRKEEDKLEWRKASAEFKEFIDLSNKPLMTIEDKDRLSQLMYEAELLHTSSGVLLGDIKGDELSLVDERRRLDAVEYLTTVLVGKYNSPQAYGAKQLALDVITKANVKPTQTEDLRRSLVGDKIELGMAMAVYHEDEWKQFKQQHTISKKLVSYIDNLALIKTEQLSDNALKIAKRLKIHKEGK
ncbi:hypothetical protein [Pseudoalteromonas sp. S558]|uniref:hypothetical protein n=1 Tax=Pseudoalteromonas sp. S558 TaxID=2066515 RepID=UPI00110A6571|nr:hypothetical protein [Pseudoalteromonas sp. S558]TMO04006.1 hypothetical protein CWB66_09430 [Pseudoalteromonas sp. S558]